MKLEDEIKQKKFANEYQKLAINIQYTSSWLYLKNVHALKPYDISPEQFNVLRILRGQYPNPSSILLIIERMLDKSSNASRIVEKLRVKGLVERKECLTDRRLVDVVITDKGLELLKALDIEVQKWLDYLSVIPLEDAEKMNDWLDKIRK
ncbi:MAG: MarR family transcriptional regulator [Cytophagales bacterium]|nr:MarR family transcriptional regulator [Cytophagales bacterium]